MWHKDAGAISKHNISKWIDLQGPIISVYVKRKGTQDWALSYPMFNILSTRIKILCFWKF